MSLKPLLDEQRRASAPDVCAFVSASAGTGKTQVLTARLLRLLLAGARPESILALTFTKAAAAEMQNRLFETLAGWVRADDTRLTDDLAMLGVGGDAATLHRARGLFAHALEARGGLKVQTLHAFASSLLSAFPLEAGIAPGHETLDDRSSAALRRALLVGRATNPGGTDQFRDDLAALGVALGERGVADEIAALMKARDAFEDSYGRDVDWQQVIRRALGVPSVGSGAEILAEALSDTSFDWPSVRDYAARLVAWGTKGALTAADTLATVLAATPAARVDMIDTLLGVGLTGKREARKPGKKNDPDFAAAHDRFTGALLDLHDLVLGIALAERAALSLRIGAALAADYAAAKAAAGVVDYDDLIRLAAALLKRIDMEFVRYKLDQRIDHVLVDEGQDTNADQWTIIEAITAEFFTGAGAREGGVVRTQFAVGDYKQAIFGFQGTDPRQFEAARQRLCQRASDAGSAYVDVTLSHSFRSLPAILDVVDATVAAASADAFGVNQVSSHDATRAGAGAVVLWPAVGEVGSDDEGETDASDDSHATDAERLFADRLADEVADWLRRGEWLGARDRAITPGDILILVTRRGELVPALVAALSRAGVPVAGADRLRLTQPIAVQDLVALLRFVLQPADDLSLAAVLVSPIFGWSQAQLMHLALGRSGSLWRQLRERAPLDAQTQQVADALGLLLARADFLTPYAFLEYVLSGPLAARAQLVARLGAEALDPIEELVNQALLFEAANPPSLEGFLSWLAAEDIDVKREADVRQDMVRIMTVHSAKGLQAPVVILADAASARPRAPGTPLSVDARRAVPLPLFHGGRTRLNRFAAGLHDRAARDAAKEHMRLLYVAMTRAEDRLYVGGARKTGASPSWQDHIAAGLARLDGALHDDPRWGADTTVYQTGEASPRGAPAEAGPAFDLPLPAWLHQPPPAEEEPPRPLVPSAIAADDVALPPAGTARRHAARRGQMLHRLFEEVGSIAPGDRARLMSAWLAVHAPELDATALVAEVLAIVDDPQLAELFGVDALAEAPLSAIVDGRTIAGTVDRLLVAEDRVLVLDFKTGLSVPATAGDVPAYHRRQMEAYRAALTAIFPGRRIDVALLYTAGPKLVPL
jgi:ATP-dependent helicase/nuclease subunit A